MFKAIRNLKISTRLVACFGGIIVLTVVLGIVGVVSLRMIDNDYRVLIDYTQERKILMLNVQTDIMDLRRITTAVRADVGNEARQAGHERAAAELMAGINAMVQNHIVLAQGDPTLSNEAIGGMNMFAGRLLEVLEQYHRNLMLANIAYARALNYEAVAANATAHAPLIAELQDILGQLINAEGMIMTGTVDLMQNNVRNYVRIFVVIATVTAVISALFAYIISGSITKPMKRITDVADNVAQGRFNVNLVVTGKDETALLSNSFGAVVQNVTNIANDINDMRGKHENGLIDARLDSGRYQGAYKNISDSINNMVNNYVVQPFANKTVIKYCAKRQ